MKRIVLAAIVIFVFGCKDKEPERYQKMDYNAYPSTDNTPEIKDALNGSIVSGKLNGRLEARLEIMTEILQTIRTNERRYYKCKNRGDYDSVNFYVGAEYYLKKLAYSIGEKARLDTIQLKK